MVEEVRVVAAVGAVAEPGIQVGVARRAPAASAAALDPLIVTAPVIRSGTTLLQRLLCSSPRALIYGELPAQDLEFFLNLYTFKVQEYTYHRERLERGLQQVLDGQVDDWIPDLMPDVDEYLSALATAAFAGVALCRDYARRQGRPVWGFKHPGWQPPLLRMVRKLLPQARLIAIRRDLAPCLRSAKAQGAVDSAAQVREFCRTWAEGVAFLATLSDDPAVLVLRYEDLLQQPQAAMQRITAFTGLDDMNPAVLQRKINAFAGSDYVAQAPGGYAPPAELSDAEREMVAETTEGGAYA
jgi:hypothetical protein